MKNKIIFLLISWLLIAKLCLLNAQVQGDSLNEFSSILKSESSQYEDIAPLVSNALFTIGIFEKDKKLLEGFVSEENIIASLDNCISIRRMEIADYTGTVQYSSYLFCSKESFSKEKEKENCIALSDVFYNEFDTLVGLSQKYGYFSSDLKNINVSIFLVTRKVEGKIKRSILLKPDLVVSYGNVLLGGENDRYAKYYFNAYNFVMSLGILYQMGYHDIGDVLFRNAQYTMKSLFDKDFDIALYLKSRGGLTK